MPEQSIENIINRLKKSNEWLSDQQALHIARVTKAVDKLESDIINSVMQLNYNRAGRIEGMRTNVENLKAVHRDITKLYMTDFDAETRKMVTTFKNAKLDIARNYAAFGEDIKWTGVDEDAMAALKASDKAQYAAIGQASQERVTQSLYNNVIGGGSMADLIKEIRNETTGIKTMTGRPLSSYAELYANDMIMNFHNQVTMLKAEELGMDRFLYYGGIMSTSRDFCIQRVGKIYTKKEIDSWTFKWAGKRGDAWNYRGGWNCRHHWQPVRKKWVDKYDSDVLENMFKRISEPSLKKPLRKPKPAVPLIKPTMPIMPDVTAVSNFLSDYDASERVVELKAKYEVARKAYKDADSKYKTLAKKMIEIKRDTPKYQDVLEQAREVGNKVATNKSMSMKLKRQMNQEKADAVNKFIRPNKTQSLPFSKNISGLSKIKKTRASQLKKIEKMAADAGMMLHENISKLIPTHYIKYKRASRAYHSKRLNEVGIGSLTDTKAFVHEFGHALEESYPEARRAVKAFRTKRTKGESLTAIYYGTDEMGWRDEFFDHYCGKRYKSGSTEILSMGIEKMYTDPVGFLKKDPEYFELILKIMWGEI